MILNLDCKIGLSLLTPNSVDAIVTDPPYEIGFMGNQWDSSGISYDVALWKDALRVLKPGGYILAFASSRTYHRLACAIEDAGAEIRDSIMWVYASGFPKGTSALKPAHEIICVARKPISEINMATNLARWGTGSINIENCRIPINPELDASQLRTMNVSLHHGNDGWGMNTVRANPTARVLGTEGRWPSNFIHDGSPEVCDLLPNNSARFYYCAKASKTDRDVGNTHPTVKPINLMRYLCKLVCPAGGIILDIFAGSGSTGKAALLEKFKFIGFELDANYTAIANARLQHLVSPTQIVT